MKFFRNLSAKLLQRKANDSGPSVVDYKTEKALKVALSGKKEPAVRRTSDSSISTVNTIGEPIEWKLSILDTKNSEPQTMEEEIKRLQVLQSYFILDSPTEDEFDRLTRLASKVFDAEISAVSLIDLGRQWFMSKVGFDAPETPRSIAFCAHTILNKQNILIVPDATKDERFKDNPFVTGGVVRFYAGAALVSPEGYKLGSLCVISSKPRSGITENEQQMLREMAGIVVNTMVARRDRLLKAQLEAKMHELGQSFVDASATLDDTEKSIAGIVARQPHEVESEEINTLSRAVGNLDVQKKMCRAAARALFREEDKPPTKNQEKRSSGSSDTLEDVVTSLELILDPSTDMKQLFKNLNSVVTSFPRNVPIITEMDGSVPTNIRGEDLLLFRSTLNLITHSMGRAEKGTIHLRIRAESDFVFFECQDSGSLIPEEKGRKVWRGRSSLLAPVAAMVRSMDGQFGTRQGRLDDKEQSAAPMSIFWFRVSLEVPESLLVSTTNNGIPVIGASLVQKHETRVAKKNATTGSKASDPFQSVLLNDAATNCVLGNRQ